MTDDPECTLWKDGHSGLTGTRKRHDAYETYRKGGLNLACLDITETALRKGKYKPRPEESAGQAIGMENKSFISAFVTTK